MAEREQSDAEGLEEADLDEPLGPVPGRSQATRRSGGDDDGEDSGVAEALRAWQAGGRSVEGDAEGDEILPVQFAQLEAPAPRKARPRLSRINNVYVDITVELGRKDMSVRELMSLKEQEVIDLDKLAGEPFDILINGRRFAEGEIVVVTDLMAVRITRLIDRTYAEEDEEP